MLIRPTFTDEQSAIRDTVRGLLDKHSDLRASVSASQGWDKLLWAEMSALGLTGIGVPEQLGGVGGGSEETFILFSELGRSLAPSPLFASLALAGNLLVEADRADFRDRYLPQVARGELTATLAICEDSGSWDPDRVEMTARDTPTGVRLTGTKRYVIDGATADVIVVLARIDGELGAYVVDRNSAGLGVSPLQTLDLTRAQADLTFTDVAANPLITPGEGSRAIERALRTATAALVAEQVGGAERMMAMALEYAKIREQFGRPIGGYQAIKHKLADMAFDVERMVSAAWAIRNDEPRNGSHAAAVHVAKSFCSEAYFRIAAETIQIHGGIGFTWEHPAHLYFRRAKSSEVILGSPFEHRQKLFDRISGI